jgi:hypothetical protein
MTRSLFDTGGGVFDPCQLSALKGAWRIAKARLGQDRAKRALPPDTQRRLAKIIFTLAMRSPAEPVDPAAIGEEAARVVGQLRSLALLA